MGLPVSDKYSEDYLKIKELVGQAKEAEKQQNYKEAKKYFLDAASISLKISKEIGGVEEVTYRNIAKILVDNAKEMQLLLEMEKDPLPSVPGTVRPPKQDVPVFSKKDDPKLLQLIIISNSGLPVFTWAESEITDTEQTRINDILFSGAITAVNSLISEVLSKPIQSINIEDGTITLRFRDDYTFVVYFKGSAKALEDNIEKFSGDFCKHILPRAEADINRGIALNKDEEVLKLLSDSFVT